MALSLQSTTPSPENLESTAVSSTARKRGTVREFLARGKRSYSFEFFPPKNDDGERQLWRTLRELEKLEPTFVSVTYGAGGSTRDRTVRITGEINAETTMTPVAHLTCVSHSRAELRQIIGSYAAQGLCNVLALRGDPEGGPRAEWVAHPEGLNYANELVGLVRELGDFCVGVAAFPDVHPASKDLEEDAETLLKKQEAGADYAITQFFFGSDDYFRLRELSEQRGVTIPIIPGIMPVTNVKQIKRFAELSGADMPDWLVEQLHSVEDDPDAVRATGIRVATELATRLLEGGAPGLHFYTLNRSPATREIFTNLREAGYVDPTSAATSAAPSST